MIRGPFRNRSSFDRIFLTMGLSGLVYAFYYSNQKQFTGSILVFSLTTLEFICAFEAWVILLKIQILTVFYFNRFF